MDQDALADQSFVSRYSKYGWLPGEISLSFVASRDWLERSFSGPGDLCFSGSRTVAGLRRDFVKAVY